MSIKATEEQVQKMTEYFNKIEEEKKRFDDKVRTKEYQDWLCNYLKKNKSIDDEEALYFKNQTDKENGGILSYFLHWIDEIAKEQRVMNVPDEDNIFEAYRYVVRMNDIYFEISLMIGQGALTFCVLCDEPKHAIVNLNYIH